MKPALIPAVQGSRDPTPLYQDIEAILGWSQEEVFGLEPVEVDRLQLHWLRRRFGELRPRLKALDKLARDLAIDDITTLDDAVPLCFPHTMYKAYTIGDVENRRFDRLTRWLGTLTTHDLSGVDLDGVDSLDTWLDRLEASTPLRPQVSSGTSGKISVQPKSLVEGRHLMEGQLRVFYPYRDEPGFDPHSGIAPFVSPWPARTGRHHLTTTQTLLCQYIFGGREEMVVTLGQQRLSADELWLGGKLRRAEALGEELQLTPNERTLSRKLAERAKETPFEQIIERFISHAVDRLRDQQVFLISTWQRMIELSQACRERGVKASYAPGSLFMIGGGSKGFVYPDGWLEQVQEIFPVDFIESYGMSESSACSRLCPAGYYHLPPWGISWVLDPQTSQPYPRSGVTTGRHACFDLLSQSYWAGTISGDKVTMHWDGGCTCGRKGPYLEKNVQRYSEAQGGDDKISCSKTPDAYDNLVRFALSDTLD